MANYGAVSKFLQDQDFVFDRFDFISTSVCHNADRCVMQIAGQLA